MTSDAEAAARALAEAIVGGQWAKPKTHAMARALLAALDAEPTDEEVAQELMRGWLADNRRAGIQPTEGAIDERCRYHRGIIFAMRAAEIAARARAAEKGAKEQ